MDIRDTVTVNTSRSVVIYDLQEPEVLQRVIPNCTKVERLAEHSYIASVHEQISLVTLDLDIEIDISDFNPPSSFAVVVLGEAPGSNTEVNADMLFELSDLEQGNTLIDYSMDISVTGKLASLGFRALKQTVIHRIDQMVENIEQEFNKKG